MPKDFNALRLYLGKMMVDCIEDFNLRDLKILLEKENADPNVLLPEVIYTPLHAVAGSENEEFAVKAMTLLLNHGGDPNIKADEDLTPVHVAASCGHARVLQILLERGGLATVTDESGQSPLDYAKQNNENEAARVLLEFLSTRGTKAKSRRSAMSILRDRMKKVKLSNQGKMQEIEEESSSNLGDIINLPFSSSECGSTLETSSCSSHHPPGSNNMNCEGNIIGDEIEARILPVCSTSKSTSETNSCSSHLSNRPKKAKNKGSNTEGEIATRIVPLSSSSSQFERTLDSNSHSIFLSSGSNKKISENNKTEDESAASVVPVSSTSSSQFESTSETNSHSSFLSSGFSNMSSEDGKTERKTFSVPRTRTSIARSTLMRPRIPKIAVTRPSSPTVVQLTRQILAHHDSPNHLSADAAFPNRRIHQWLSNVDYSVQKMGCSSTPASNESIQEKLNEATIGRHLNSELSDASAKTCTTVSECYKYSDEKQGIVLLEERLLPNHDQLSDSARPDPSGSSSVILPTDVETSNTEDLREELKRRGIFYGPITKTTKRIYKYHLHEKKKNNQEHPKLEHPKCLYSPELQRTLRENNLLYFQSRGENLEQQVTAQFTKTIKTYNWREGNKRTSFTYLLLDPRITENLPVRAANLPEKEIWLVFLKSIFYIGKGKRARPFAHLYEAVEKLKGNQYRHASMKVKRIIEIWREDLGVICLHVFQNIIPVEAYTREAAMIDAIGLHKLCNMKRSDYYGEASHWYLKDQKIFGVYLLYKAMKIFLLEGERHLKPWDVM